MAGRRVDLAALGAKAATTPPAAQAPAETPTLSRSTSEERSTEWAQPTRRRTKPKPAGEWVRYDEYERKETRLRPDQYEELSSTSRRLNRSRNRDGERITENTLIRVAIDLLLDRQDDLAGKTEAEIRKSVGL